MQFNADKIRKVLSEVILSLKRLEELRRIDKRGFLADPHKIGSAKYNLIFAIEGMIDLCNHVIAKNGLRPPNDYADSIRVLTENGAFDEELSKTLIKMTRFRNRLVHIYWDIDDTEIHRILQENLSDIKLFIRGFGAYLGISQTQE